LASAGSVTLAVLLAGCSTVFDKKPIVSDTPFGLPFMATLENVYIARVANLSETEYRDAASAAARYGVYSGDPISVTVTLLSEFASSITRATISDAERRLASARCIYILRPQNPSLAKSIRNTAFVSTIVDDDLGSSKASANRLLQSILEKDERDSTSKTVLRGARKTPIIELQDTFTEGEDGDDLISLTQICNPELELGASVMVTITPTGGTIHQSRSATSKTVGDVMRLRKILAGR